MMNQLENDITVRPELFDINGPIDPKSLARWARDKKFRIPRELVWLWEKTGGGVFFETETILSPFSTQESGDDIQSVNTYHYKNGMPQNYIIFHIGVGGLSVVDKESGYYHQIDEKTYKSTSVYNSLESWYKKAIRTNYVYRYGLQNE